MLSIVALLEERVLFKPKNAVKLSQKKNVEIFIH